MQSNAEEMMRALKVLQAMAMGDKDAAKSFLREEVKGKNRMEIVDLIYNSIVHGLNAFFQALYVADEKSIKFHGVSLVECFDFLLFNGVLRSKLGEEMFDAKFGENADVTTLWGIGSDELIQHFKDADKSEEPIPEYVSNLADRLREMN